MLPPVEMPATSIGASPVERIASACSAARSAIDVPRGSPDLRLTKITRRRRANGSSRDPLIHSVPGASTPACGERPPMNSSGAPLPVARQGSLPIVLRSIAITPILHDGGSGVSRVQGRS